MLFNSIEFAIFLPIVFVLYWFVTQHNVRWQNVLIVASSYLFYGWWDWRFLGLVLFSTVLDFSIGVALDQQTDERRRRWLIGFSLAVNLGFLGFFKYFNFFVDNFVAAFTFLGMPFDAPTLRIILPVGISFYTFQTLSYTIDVYRRELKATRDIIAFAAFVSYFPQLVAGPIERATQLLPQFYHKKIFDPIKARDGLRQALWGFFKKMVIADNCAEYANLIFNHSEQYSGWTLVVGALCFTFQIYGDFSGYSDIAIGTSRLFGIDLMRNFAYPYFSRDMAEFWRRWHISLSTWFRDYLYVPLGGSRGSTALKVRNTFIIFLVSGFWHGANWTFITWGALNALYFLPLLLSARNRTHLGTVAAGRFLPDWRTLMQMTLTFWLAVLAWIFFRAENMSHAYQFLSGIFSSKIFSLHILTELNHSELRGLAQLGVLLAFFMSIEWWGRAHDHPMALVGQVRSRPLRWLLYALLITLTGLFMQTEETPFIYFQF